MVGVIQTWIITELIVKIKVYKDLPETGTPPASSMKALRCLPYGQVIVIVFTSVFYLTVIITELAIRQETGQDTTEEIEETRISIVYFQMLAWGFLSIFLLMATANLMLFWELK